MNVFIYVPRMDLKGCLNVGILRVHYGRGVVAGTIGDISHFGPVGHDSLVGSLLYWLLLKLLGLVWCC